MVVDRRVLRRPTGGNLTIQQLGQKALQGPEQDGNSYTFENPVARFNVPRQDQQGAAGITGTTPTITPANIAAGFQWTGEYDAANRGLQQQESDAGLGRTNSLASIAEQYAIAMRKAEEQGSKGKKSLFARLADKGALGSGMALEDIAEYDTSYNDYLNDISRSRASDLAGVETNYATRLNSIGRERETLAARQQTAEQARMKEEARLASVATQAAAENEARRQQLADMAAAQQAAAQAAQQAIAAASAQVNYNPPSVSNYYGDNSDESYSPPVEQAPAQASQAPAQAEPPIVLPPFGHGSGSAPLLWIKKNIDPTLNSSEVSLVLGAMNRAGAQGMTRTQLGQFIQGMRIDQGSF
jgi:hypothetical protein